MIGKLKNNIGIILIILFAFIGVIGYSTKQAGSPVMVLIKTKAGNVKFSHKVHSSEYEIECDTCHHDTDSEEEIWKCRECHRTGTADDVGCEDNLHKFCIGDTCFDCHKDEGREKDEWGCEFCHKVW